LPEAGGTNGSRLTLLGEEHRASPRENASIRFDSVFTKSSALTVAAMRLLASASGLPWLDWQQQRRSAWLLKFSTDYFGE
jgi:hypothetical protein